MQHDCTQSNVKKRSFPDPHRRQMSQNLYSYITSGKSSSSLHRDSTSLPTPQLTLNGKPINPPSSAAYPPKVRSRRGSRSSTHMAGTSSSSNVSSSRAENDARPTSSSSAATERPAMNQRKSSGAVKAAIKATPNPFLHPAAALEYITWRIWLWFSGNLSLGMLTDTEVILLSKSESR